MQIEGNGLTITSVQSWFDAAPPKGGTEHWVSGRSARELAEAWCASNGPCVPPESSSCSSPIRTWSRWSLSACSPSARSGSMSFGVSRETPPRHRGAMTGGILAITVEGKADETFDRPVATILEKAAARIAKDKRTGAIARIEALSAGLLPSWREGLPHLGELRYSSSRGLRVRSRGHTRSAHHGRSLWCTSSSPIRRATRTTPGTRRTSVPS